MPLQRSMEIFITGWEQRWPVLKDLESIPTRIFESGILKEDGLLVLEHGKENHFEDNPHFIERRVYGSVNFSFFKAMVPATEQ